MDKDFLNKAALQEVLAKPPREQMVLLHLDEAAVTAPNADATGGEPVFKDGKGVGRVTSGTYGYSVDMSLALAMVKDAAPGDEVEVMVLGQPAHLIKTSSPGETPPATHCKRIEPVAIVQP